MITNDDVKKIKKIFATKDDLKKFATKDDLKNSSLSLEFKLENKIEKTKQELLDRIDEKYDKIFNLVDGLASGIRDARDSKAIFSYRIEDLEKRTKVLEKSLVQWLLLVSESFDGRKLTGFAGRGYTEDNTHCGRNSEGN